MITQVSKDTNRYAVLWYNKSYLSVITLTYFLIKSRLSRYVIDPKIPSKLSFRQVLSPMRISARSRSDQNPVPCEKTLDSRSTDCGNDIFTHDSGLIMSSGNVTYKNSLYFKLTESSKVRYKHQK
jgi:hypothetical protein